LFSFETYTQPKIAIEYGDETGHFNAGCCSICRAKIGPSIGGGVKRVVEEVFPPD
jgi:hypothetical protein